MTLRLPTRRPSDLLILSDARLYGKRIDVIVDTGAQTSVGNLALQKLGGAKRANRLPFLPTTLGAVTGEAVPAVRTAIRRGDGDKLEAWFTRDRKSTRLNTSH